MKVSQQITDFPSKVNASCHKHLDRAENDLHKLKKEYSKTKEIQSMAIGKLSDAQRHKVMRLETKHDTKIQISQISNRIVIRGASASDVSNANLGNVLPAHWDPQPKDAKGKELDVHLVVLDPTNHKREYDQVKTAVEKTNPINIVKIERVQNPTLYKTYAVKKQKMDDGKGSNEKKLFHGTAPATFDLINHKGFNRSYCGKNATVYGKGVYFARDASYSMRATYSPPDPGTGRRCMYMASVLAGEFTQGKQYMVAPPAKNPYMPTITYDTVVDNVSTPGIYVVFHDTQNYPDYLITFQ